MLVIFINLLVFLSKFPKQVRSSTRMTPILRFPLKHFTQGNQIDNLSTSLAMSHEYTSYVALSDLYVMGSIVGVFMTIITLIRVSSHFDLEYNGYTKCNAIYTTRCKPNDKF